MNWPAPGVHRNLPSEDYFSLKQIDGKLVRSNSMLHAFIRDPKEFRAGYEVKETASMRAGSLFDCLMTAPHRYDEYFVVSPYDDFRSNGSKEWRKDQIRTVIKQSDFAEAERAVHAVKAHPIWQKMTKGKPSYQVGLRADFDGQHWKGMLDLLPDEDCEYGDCIVDLKRLGQMETVEDVLKTCRKFRYDEQMGLYRGLARINGLKRNRAILFIVQQSGPVNPCVIELSEGMLGEGAEKIMRINRKLTECEQSGIWPGRFDGILKVDQMNDSYNWQLVEEPLKEA